MKSEFVVQMIALSVDNDSQQKLKWLAEQLKDANSILLQNIRKLLNQKVITVEIKGFLEKALIVF